jgi:tRNA (guanine37-N1)-methyltransferase
MRVDVVTLFPELIAGLLRGGITGRAAQRGLIEVVLWNPRDYTFDTHRTVDDRPYGGGPGMLMKVAPLQAALEAARAQAGRRLKTVCLSPQGRRLDQSMIDAAARESGILLLAGRYEGIDERVIEAEVDEEWSIGDYVLSGGELAAMVVIDAVTRLVPGALGHGESAAQDSFAQGLLDCPHYTRPEEIDGRRVPQVLLSGNHEAIRRWRMKQALGRTWTRRKDLIEKADLTAEQRALLAEFLQETDPEQNAPG